MVYYLVIHLELKFRRATKKLKNITFSRSAVEQKDKRTTVMYLSIGLHYRSVNLDDSGRMSIQEFRAMASEWVSEWDLRASVVI